VQWSCVQVRRCSNCLTRLDGLMRTHDLRMLIFSAFLVRRDVG
jgi:hypothetical protein